MSWGRFKFYCNEVGRLLDRGEEVIPAFEKAKKSVLSEEFGKELETTKIQESIFTSMKKNDYSKKQVREALRIYDALDISGLTENPSKVRRVGIYIGYLSLMYFMFSGTYLIYVIPRMESIFDSMGIPPPENFTRFMDNWVLILILVMLLLLLAFLVSKKLKDMFEFKNGVENTFIFRFFLPKKMKIKYKNIRSLICLPLRVCCRSEDGVNDKIVEHYCSEAYRPEEVASSLAILINENMRSLILLAESFIQRIYVIVAVLIIYTIYEFLSSAYTPLFVIGEVT